MRGFPCGSAGKESAYNVGDLGLIPGLGRSLAKRKATHSSIRPGEFHGLYSSRGRKELDTTEWLSLSLHGWCGCPWCHWELQTVFLGLFPFWVEPTLHYLYTSPQSHSEQVQSHSKAGLWFSTDIIRKPSLLGNSSHGKHKPSSAQPMKEPWAWVPATCYLVNTPLPRARGDWKCWAVTPVINHKTHYKLRH